ncbi:unnamed protein product, partial [Didymodactylos carnosus]
EKAVIIMDEGLYHSVIKVKDQNPLEFEGVILLGGDFHALMNYMRMVWSVLDGSGIHELLNYLYQGATLKSVVNVTNFNKSLRATKLLYTALYVTCFEQFLATTNVQQSITDALDNIPSFYTQDNVKQKWCNDLINTINNHDLEKKFKQYYRFCKTLVYRTLIYSVIREIADIETNSNALDGHVECSPSRLQIDRQDLNILISKLKHENVLSSQSQQMTDLFTGKIVHNDIIDSICSSFSRGELELKKFVQERLIDKSVHIDSKMTRMKTLKLIDTDTYGRKKQHHKRNKQRNNMKQTIKPI